MPSRALMPECPPLFPHCSSFSKRFNLLHLCLFLLEPGFTLSDCFNEARQPPLSPHRLLSRASLLQILFPAFGLPLVGNPSLIFYLARAHHSNRSRVYASWCCFPRGLLLLVSFQDLPFSLFSQVRRTDGTSRTFHDRGWAFCVLTVRFSFSIGLMRQIELGFSVPYSLSGLGRCRSIFPLPALPFRRFIPTIFAGFPFPPCTLRCSRNCPEAHAMSRLKMVHVAELLSSSVVSLPDVPPPFHFRCGLCISELGFFSLMRLLAGRLLVPFLFTSASVTAASKSSLSGKSCPRSAGLTSSPFPISVYTFLPLEVVVFPWSLSYVDGEILSRLLSKRTKC